MTYDYSKEDAIIKSYDSLLKVIKKYYPEAEGQGRVFYRVKPDNTGPLDDRLRAGGAVKIRELYKDWAATLEVLLDNKYQVLEITMYYPIRVTEQNRSKLIDKVNELNKFGTHDKEEEFKVRQEDVIYFSKFKLEGTFIEPWIRARDLLPKIRLAILTFQLHIKELYETSLP